MVLGGIRDPHPLGIPCGSVEMGAVTQNELPGSAPHSPHLPARSGGQALPPGKNQQDKRKWTQVVPGEV